MQSEYLFADNAYSTFHTFREKREELKGRRRAELIDRSNNKEKTESETEEEGGFESDRQLKC